MAIWTYLQLPDKLHNVLDNVNGVSLQHRELSLIGRGHLTVDILNI